MAGKSGRGQYSLVHDRARPPSSIEEEIREAARKFGVIDSDLGVKTVTVRVSGAASVAELRARFRSAYRDVGDDSDDSEVGSGPVDRLKYLAIGLTAISVGAAIGIYIGD